MLGPQRVTADMIDALRGFRSFDPEHLPEEIRLIEALSPGECHTHPAGLSGISMRPS